MAETIYYDDKFSPVSVVIDTVYWVEPWQGDIGSIYVKFRAGGPVWEYAATSSTFKAFGSAVSAGSYYAHYIRNRFSGSAVYGAVFAKRDIETDVTSNDEVGPSRFDVVYTDSLGREVFFPTQATSETDAIFKASEAAGGFVNLNLKLIRVVHYFD